MGGPLRRKRDARTVPPGPAAAAVLKPSRLSECPRETRGLRAAIAAGAQFLRLKQGHALTTQQQQAGRGGVSGFRAALCCGAEAGQARRQSEVRVTWSNVQVEL